ncbi:glutathione S-transferase family protein [Microvirga alba]|uniref:Glutathione S-transferase family protein n=1 Tax=Microvirga alba TaxID=2791025 RepID=A0A931BQY4_9HYPH|nr:glutathione S-transferase family protein [Microvirga alba]MBF9233144.1 glutathione S-transferase family protein [Microvirga alba]
MRAKPIVYHIPVCPFCQRIEILLNLKGHPDAVEFRVVDITKPRDPELLQKTRGTTALPVLETADGRILKESLVILQYLDETVPGVQQRRADPFQHAVERMLIAKEGPLISAGYAFVMNQDRDALHSHQERLLRSFSQIDDFLREHSPQGDFLFSDFGLAEAVFTPIFMRFWFLEYYEGFDLPANGEFERVRRWRQACLAHPAAQQTSREEILKLYYDYALGAGNGALLPGRTRSSFVFEPHWKTRPWPPADKYGQPASDEALGLLAG